MTYRKMRLHNLDGNDKLLFTVTFILLLMSFVDTILYLVYIYNGTVTCILRPIIVTLLFENVR